MMHVTETTHATIVTPAFTGRFREKTFHYSRLHSFRTFAQADMFLQYEISSYNDLDDFSVG